MDCTSIMGDPFSGRPSSTILSEIHHRHFTDIALDTVASFSMAVNMAAQKIIFQVPFPHSMQNKSKVSVSITLINFAETGLCKIVPF